MDRYQANLDRLSGNLQTYAAANCPPRPAGDERLARSTKLGNSLFLAHSTSDAKFARICREGLKGGRGSVEVAMGTAESVFFYLSPFRYPNTGCGVLFAGSLESSRRHDGVASPFDSGSLLHHCGIPDSSETPQAFLMRHELAVPDHRRYLTECLTTLFEEPADYVSGRGPHLPGPVGLTGGDNRRWTHEVRIKDSVDVRSKHLQAVFAPRPRVYRDPNIRELFGWCLTAGVDRVEIDTPGDNDFEALQRECLEYVGRKLY